MSRSGSWRSIVCTCGAALLLAACDATVPRSTGSSSGARPSSSSSSGSTSSGSTGSSGASGSGSSGSHSSSSSSSGSASSSGGSGSSSSGSGSSSGSSGASSGGSSSSGGTLPCQPGAVSGSSFTADEAGALIFTLQTGRLRVHVCKEDILRVQYTTGTTFPTKTSMSVSATWGKTPFCVAEAQGVVTITTTRLKAKVSTGTGLVTFVDLADKTILAEDGKTLASVNVSDVGATHRPETTFSSPSDEALFGLGQHQENVGNRKGTRQHIENSNTQINVPLLVSNKGYGLFWDNYSKSDFDGTVSSNTKYRYTSETGDQVDYYFFYGPSIDGVIAGYRTATGAAPLFPKWAYGLFHSKDKYGSQRELLAVKDGYRNNNIPIDCIVQDWDYWTPYAWGSHFMDEGRYPSPATLISDMHKANVHTMISIWPVYDSKGSGKAGELDNFSALNGIGAMLPSGGSHHFYDVFDPEARRLVFQQIQDRLLGKYGWDGIWADNTEPQAYPDPLNMHAADTKAGKGGSVINAYPLGHAKALYEGWRSAGPKDKRVYVLTRSAFSGQQRYATTCWSGDINSDFPTFTKQIPAGLHFGLAGMPYWTTDIGGYWGHNIDWSSSGNQELFTRWFQYGAFCPTFRIHGGGSRELYGNQWNATTKANLLKIDKLRYRLMPYVYSLAGKVTNEGYTMMRHLVFDYPQDSKVFGVKDQFLFGPALLVNPVTSAGATSRSVYLPAGKWFDFWTGATENGGNTLSASAPLSLIPLYVKAGSIVPMGPEIQYATESIDPLEIRVYKGQDGAFTLYDDEGDGYGYESGKSAQITFTWSESAQKLTIGARKGSYPGMPQSRTFNVVWVGPSHGTGVEVTAAADKKVTYDGSEVAVSAN